jgi:hypothetical protein
MVPLNIDPALGDVNLNWEESITSAIISIWCLSINASI